jgi:hypothetical protein
MSIIIVVVIAAVCVLFNLFVTRRINSAFYLEERRRRFHKNFIWLAPFVGPIIIKGFWRKTHAVKFVTMTKQLRDKKKGDFYESGIGLDS